MAINESVAIGIIIVIVILLVFWNNCTEDLSGFWLAPSSFLQESGADQIILYMAKIGSNTYTAHIMIQENGEMITNEPFEVSLTKKSSTQSATVYNFDTDLSEDESIPKSMTAEYYKESNKLILYSGDVMYALLYKDPEYSDLSMEQSAKGIEDQSLSLQQSASQQQSNAQSQQNQSSEEVLDKFIEDPPDTNDKL